MADTCCTYTFGSLTVNPSSGDGLTTDFEEGQILGLDGAPVRKQIDPQGQSDGGIVHPAFFGARIIQFQGKVLITSVPEGAPALTYAAAVNVVEAAAVAALEAQLNSAATLAWTPTGGSGKSISCTYGTPGGEIQFSGNMVDRKFQFTLVAANPTIT
jgi:hypothetical protein